MAAGCPAQLRCPGVDSVESCADPHMALATASQLVITSSLLAGSAVLAFFFAMVEIQIEGSDGWATKLPTWRIEKHWLLDVFFGGRALTGYHAWMLSFMALFFHFPILVAWSWSWRIEERLLGCMIVFWILEDLLWFVFNPAWGWRRFNPVGVPWHKRWFLGFPQDYWLFGAIAVALFCAACRA